MKKLSIPTKYRKEAIKSILAILKNDYEISRVDKTMVGQYRDGYLMGYSDAIELIEDLPISQ